MTIGWRKHWVFAIASGTIVCAVVLLSIALTYPEAVTDPGLGSGWECRSRLFVTSCTRVERPLPATRPAVQTAALEKTCPLRLDESAGNARSAPFTWSVTSKPLDDRPRAKR
jgi:hypothetical protein